MIVRTNSSIKITRNNNKIMFRYIINEGLKIIIKDCFRLLLETSMGAYIELLVSSGLLLKDILIILLKILLMLLIECVYFFFITNLNPPTFFHQQRSRQIGSCDYHPKFNYNYNQFANEFHGRKGRSSHDKQACFN
jgi:hypothetical protein